MSAEPNMSLLRRFEQQVEQSKSAVALVSETGQLTYEELDSRARRFAGLLQSKGQGAGNLVALLMDNSMEAVTAILGVLKAGAAWLPLSPKMPISFLREILRDAGATFLVASEKYVHLGNRLQWECPKLKTIYCPETTDIYAISELENEMSKAELWDYVGEQADDDITGGGWFSSYTGEKLGRLDMEEYSENIFLKLKPWLHAGTNVLEIGCASGISMFRIAPQVALYHGTDLSGRILELTEKRVTDAGLKNVRLSHLPADRIDEVEGEGYDVVVINSVVQSFRGLNYLRQVMRKSMTQIPERGILFLGDLQDVDLKDELVSEMEAFAADNQGKGYRTKTNWSNELFISREFLEDLKAEFPEIQNIQFSRKIGTAENELTRFRFDAILEIDRRATSVLESSPPRHREQLDQRALPDSAAFTPDGDLNEEALAYLIYTSGSTGKPKGVAIQRRSLNNYINWAARYYFASPEQGNMALFTSLSFDLTITSLFCPLVRGKQLFVYGGNDPADLLTKVFNNPGIDTVKMTPSHVSVLNYLPLLYPMMQQVILGGEVVGENHLRMLQAISPDITVYNEYGPTETTVACTAGVASESYFGIGKPIQGAKIFLLDEYTQLVPRGLPGEICVSGICLAANYFREEKQTAEKFVDNPFQPGERLYKTGDLAQWEEDGNLRFLGRKDAQVKINGHRIEVDGIGELMRRSPQVRNSLVRAVTRDEELVLLGYYIAEPGFDEAEYRTWLADQLPAYMVPAFLIGVSEFPLNRNGKVDVEALPLPEEMVDEQDAALPARNDREALLVKIWKDVLGFPNIGIDSNFFHLGGDSIKAIQVTARLNEAGYRIKLGGVLQHPVLEEMATQLVEQAPSADQGVVSGPAPLSPIQRRFFAVGHLAPHHYNQAIMLRARTFIDATALKKVLQHLVLHHDALRMHFDDPHGRHMQHNQGREAVSDLVRVDLRGLEDAHEEMIAQANALQASLNLEKGPLFRMALFQRADSDRILLIAHHLVVDGVSWRIILEDLATLYQQCLSEKPLRLPLKTDAFIHWANALPTYATSDDLAREVTYWDTLNLQAVDRLAADFQEGANAMQDNVSHSISLDPDATSTLQNTMQEIFATNINETLLAALGMAFSEVFGINFLLLEIDGHGRHALGEDLDLSRTVGWFTCQYPMIIEADQTGDLRSYVLNIKEQVRRIPNDGVGHGILRYFRKRSSGGEAIKPQTPQVAFNFFGEMDSALQSDQFQIVQDETGAAISPSTQRAYEIEVSAMISGKCLHISFHYAKTRFEAARIEALARACESAFETLVTHANDTGKQQYSPSDFSHDALSEADIDRLGSLFD